VADNQQPNDQSTPQSNVTDDGDLDSKASVRDLFSQYQVLKVENLIVGGNFGPGSVFGSKGRVSANTIADNVNKILDLDDSASGDSSKRANSPRSEIFESDESTKQWFFSLKDARKESFVITVAIFGGNSSRFITAASDVLFSYLSPQLPSTDSSTDAPLSLFDNQPEDLLGDTGAVRDETFFNTASGRTRIEIIRFRSSNAQSRIVDLICGDYKFIRIYDKITAWLREFIEVNNITLKKLGSFEPELARTQAALAIGALARREYKHYLDNVIQKWALSKDVSLRFTVGWVLLGLIAESKRKSSNGESEKQNTDPSNSIIKGRRNITIWDKVMGDSAVQEDTLTENVLILLKHWITINNPFLQWTAVISASRIGLLEPDAVLKILKPAAGSRNAGVREAVQITLGLLYLSGSNYACKVILKLAEWATDENELVQTLACREFVTLVQGRFDETDESSALDSRTNASTNVSKRKTSLNLWDLLGNEAEPVNKSIFDATYLLLSTSLQHRDAGFVDHVCNTIVQWVINTEHSSSDAQNALLRLLHTAKNDVAIGRYVDFCLKYAELNHSTLAVQLRSK
jgi:hypothetical protein